MVQFRNILKNCLKKTESQAGGCRELVGKVYRIECELGEIATNSHKAKDNGQTTYDSGRDFFETTASRERFKSNRFRELMLDFSTDMSDRKAAARLNRIRLEQQGINPTTYRNTIEREGQRIWQCMERKCEEALSRNGFGPDGEFPCGSEFKPGKGRHIEPDEIEHAAAELNIKRFEPSDYESPEHSINISVDDVCVKRQSDRRPKEENSTQPKRVNNTVIHVQGSEGKYILNAATLSGALRLLVGFLLNCGLLGCQLIFFTDGARDLHGSIPKVFHFANIKIILDWYHLKKKCQEQLSMALKGSKIRNEFLKELLPCLWFGNVDGAILLLRNIDGNKVKNHEMVTKLIEYLERVRGFVPCYALRKKLGLRNSSNLGEKANDLVVANRQKHNGMSWSGEGSVAFASVASASCNSEINNWVYFHAIKFAIVDDTAA